MLLSPWTSHAASPDPAQLVASLKHAAPARTPYTEVRFSSLFERPLILRGELEYLGPGQLGKRVDTPYQEQTTIRDGEVEVQRQGREARRFSLSRAPELEGFLRGFAALLGGDVAVLQQDFKLDASGALDNWRLTLTPRDARLAQRIRAIEVDGSTAMPRCFRIRDADGDVNVMLVDALAATPLPTRPSPMIVDGLCRGIAAR